MEETKRWLKNMKKNTGFIWLLDTRIPETSEIQYSNGQTNYIISLLVCMLLFQSCNQIPFEYLVLDAECSLLIKLGQQQMLNEKQVIFNTFFIHSPFYSGS